MRESDRQTWGELTLDDLIADAALIQLPAPRAARPALDLRIPAPRSIRIPDATVSLVDGYAEYGA
jgi:hypothetical protein